MSGITVAEANAILGDVFAPWVQALKLEATEVSAEHAVLQMPFNEELCRVGEMICGQALISAADTAMVIAVCSKLGGFKPVGTVDLTSNFMRPVSGEGVVLTARIMRAGRTMAFCNTEVAGTDSGKLSAFATGTYALPA
ncbi:MAG: PaaI family thioesterase [Rhizobiales bacterium]|nr:PaaI family thioesterase [Hyphomicrobiales bacterium]